MRPARFASDIWRVICAPRIEISIFGSESARGAYRAFVAPHPRFRIIKSKTVGVALVPIEDGFDAYLAGGSNELLRRLRRRSAKAGFRFASCTPIGRTDEILEINRSMLQRQGRPMAATYFDRDAVELMSRGDSDFFAVLDSSGVLKAYAYASILGEVFAFSRLLGHEDSLRSGVMYLLVSEVIRHYVGKRSEYPRLRWGMYDTYFGGEPGLRYFKHRTGFRPYTVRWRWEET